MKMHIFSARFAILFPDTSRTNKKLDKMDYAGQVIYFCYNIIPTKAPEIKI